MHLSDIFAKTAYNDTLFNATEIAALESQIIIKQSRGKDIPYTTCFLRNKQIELKPEEVVRQLYLYRLIHKYGYPLDRIRVEYPVTFGRDDTKRADIVIMNKLNPDAAYIIVEVKKPKLKDGKEQLKSYTNATGAPIAVWTNGQHISAYNRRDPNYFEEITDIPQATESLADVLNERVTYEQLKALDKIKNERRSLRALIIEMEDEILANAGVDSFEEVFKLIFAKLYDELVCANDSMAYLQFRNGGESDDELYEKISRLFQRAKDKWEGIFGDSDAIRLTPSHLSVCVSSLQNVKLFNNNLDVVDDAFEYLMSKVTKSEKGQYFTPRYVIDMCVKMMNPHEGENIIDTAAGSSGFTVHAIFHVWKAIRAELGLEAGEGFTTDRRTEREISFVRNHVFSIDFDDKPVRVARTLNLIAGDGQTNVIHLNTLDYGAWAESTKQQAWIDNYNQGFRRLRKIRPNPNDMDFSKFSFDLLMANPPFAGDIKEGKILSRYEFGRTAKGKQESKVGRDILFIERNLNFLKPGGRMAIVLPQGRFNNSSDKRIREYIAERCRILAVVGLHGNVFKPHTGTKTSVLFVQKWDDVLCPKVDDYPIFFATMQKPSKDNSGDKIYVKTTDGDPLLDSHGHLVVDHDLYNHDGLTQDGIAEAFIEFAKREKLSFFADARPFDADYYMTLMSGLECSELMLSAIRVGDFRAEAEYFSKKYLALETSVKLFPDLREYVNKIECGPFGSTLLDSEYCEEGIAFVRPLNLQNGLVSDDNIVFVSEQTIERNKLKYYPRWTLVLSRVGRYVRFGVISNLDKATISSNAIAIVPKNPTVAKFLAIFLRTKYGYLQLYRQQQYSSQPKISTSIVASLKMPKLTGFYKELTIFYDKALEKIAQSAAAYAAAEDILLEELNLQTFAPNSTPMTIKRLSESFGVSGRLDAEYFQTKYEEIAAYLNGRTGLFNVGDYFNPEDKTKYKYIELANIGTAGNITSATVDIGQCLPTRARRKVKAGQVIVPSIEGSLSSCALITDDYDGALCSTGFFVVDSDVFNPESLLVLFKSAPIQDLMKQLCSGSILPSMAKDDFAKMPLPFLDDSIQQKIAKQVQCSFQLRRESERLLDIATHAVELAVEQGEETAYTIAFVDGGAIA